MSLPFLIAIAILRPFISSLLDLLQINVSFYFFLTVFPSKVYFHFQHSFPAIVWITRCGHGTLFRGSFVFKNINLTTLTYGQPTRKKTLLFIYLLAQLSIQKIFTLTFTTISINSKCNKVNLLFSFRIFKPLTFKQFVSLTFS